MLNSLVRSARLSSTRAAGSLHWRWEASLEGERFSCAATFVGRPIVSVVAGRSIAVGEGTIFGAEAVVIDNDFHVLEREWGWGFDCSRNPRPVVSAGAVESGLSRGF